MNFCISNIAWSENHNLQIIKILNKFRIKNLEYAPGLLLKGKNTIKLLDETKKFWKKNKINLYSMQSLLYGINKAYIFGNHEQQNLFYKEVNKKIKIANKLNTKVIVFGSPKAKKTFGRSKKILNKIFENYLKKIKKISKKNKIIFCLEANPEIYGSNYLTHTKHAIHFAKKINSDYLKINLDLGTIIYNKENIKKIIKENINFIGHAQISAPLLENPLLYPKKILTFLHELKKNNYTGVVSIEFLGNNNINDIMRIFKFLKKNKFI